jgi:hypothetical protein
MSTIYIFVLLTDILYCMFIFREREGFQRKSGKKNDGKVMPMENTFSTCQHS